MYDQKLIATRYRALAFMDGFGDACEAMYEYPTLEHVPMQYLKDIQKFFRKTGDPVKFRYESGAMFTKCKKSEAECFTVEPREVKNQSTSVFITI